MCTSTRTFTIGRLLLFALFLIAFQYELSAQAGSTLRGTVTDAETNEAIIGASIVVKGTTRGVITDLDGNYSIELEDERTILRVSYIGYLAQEIVVEGLTILDVALEQDLQELDEVVVIGYGTEKKKDLTGAVSQVKSEALTQVAAVSFDQALQGRVAGVQVTNNSGEPGGDVSIRIRGVGTINGSSEPLYVIDGVPVTGGLKSINVSDIESIDVLKDAASGSIYGSRAANGVVIVTTKRGSKGKARVSFDAYWGVQSTGALYDVMNTVQFMELANEAYINAKEYSLTPAGIPNPNPAWAIDPDSSYRTTNWQNELFSTAPVQSYSLNVSGGNEKTMASLGASYLNQEGTLIGSGYKRYTLRVTVDHEVNKWLKFGGTMNFADANKQSVSTENAFRGAMQNALSNLPELPLYADVDGPFGPNELYYGEQGYAFWNRFRADPRYYPEYLNGVYQVQHNPEQWEKNMSLLGLLYLELRPIKGLLFRSSLGTKYAIPENWSKNTLLPLQITKAPNDDLRHQMSKYSHWNWINTLGYEFSLGLHDFSLMVATDTRIEDYVTFGALAKHFPTETNVSINAAGEKNGNGTYSRDNYLSYLGRFKYDYADKYLFSMVVRRDGSSKFGPQNKWGTFPAASAAWKISNEGFMESVESINLLKLRASYGVVGNDNIASGRYYSLLRFNDVLINYNDPALKILYAFGRAGRQEWVYGIEPSVLPDEAIKWEESVETNIGLDLAMFRYKMSLGLDFFRRETKDMLAALPVPFSFGAPGNTITTNFATMVNSGFEISLGYKDTWGDWQFNAGGNFALLNNEVTDLKGQIASQGFNGDIDGSGTRTVEGLPIAQFYGFKMEGIYQTQDEIDAAPETAWRVTPGDVRFYNTDEEAEAIRASDQTYLGNGLPKYNFGFYVGTNYKGFDLNLVFTGQAGVKAANMNKRLLYDMKDLGGRYMSNASVDLYENRWHGEGTSNTIPKVSYDPTSTNLAFSDFYVEDASFLRLKNIQLGYSLPEAAAKAIKVASLRIYISAQNIVTFTGYSGLDPEVGSPGGNVLLTGFDYGRYPAPRIYMIGINLGI